jgi:hypothetical protein
MKQLEAFLREHPTLSSIVAITVASLLVGALSGPQKVVVVGTVPTA